MRKKKSVERTRYRCVQIRLSPDEFQRMKENLANSTCNSLSEYIRNCTLGRPVTIYYRSRSFDDFVTEIVPLRKALQEMIATNNQEKMADTVAAIQQNINQLADYVRSNHHERKHRPNA